MSYDEGRMQSVIEGGLEKRNRVILHIEERKKERDQLEWTLKKIEELNSSVGLSDGVFEEVQAKISSKINACDRSIRDHEKLLRP